MRYFKARKQTFFCLFCVATITMQIPSCYYLKTRYYDPEAGRFVSQDGIEYLNGGTIAGITSYNAGARGWDLFGAIAE